MPSYTVTVATSSQVSAGTDNYIYLTLVGTNGSSEKTLLDKLLHNDFKRGAVDSYNINVPESLGNIELVKIEKKSQINDEWFCKNILVKTPDEAVIQFPCFRWIVDDKEVVLQDGRARLPQDEKSTILKQHRSKELENRQKMFRWHEWQPGFPLSIDAKGYKDLPRDIQYDCEKDMDFNHNFTKLVENLLLNQFINLFQTSWDSLEQFKEVFIRIKNTSSEYVMNHWQEDFLFGYQYLNGCHPVIIRKCVKIPKKFPVTHDMVANILERDLTLEEEVEAGNIFIADYDIMEDIPPNATDPHTKQYLAAPICLFYKNKQNKIYPIAIQLTQTPGEDSPIFLPSDAECDWLLAKMWVKSSDFQMHQIVSHLLKTHLILEVFNIAMFRHLPAVHPIYKLLLPHTRFTIAVNTKGREQLIGEHGVLDKVNSTAGGGHVQLIQKAMKTLTYKSLCFPDSIKARGMDNQEEMPNYFYRDDGNMVWETIKSFVGDVVSIYYGSDERVQEDKEMQAFVKDVRCFGLSDSDSCEFPKSLHTQEQLVEYVTLIIFTASAQHAAMNFGQVDWWSWVPNAPSTMRQPIPTKKGQVDMKYIMESLPDRGRSSWHVGAMWVLSQFQDNELFLGTYPDELFIEQPMKVALEKFRDNLDKVSKVIKKRNEGKKLAYFYLSPDRIPNSVAI